MAVIPTIAPGNLSDGSIWQGGSTPVAPDQALVSHDLVVDQDWDIGHSPDANNEWALEIQSGVNVTFNSNLSITLRGGWLVRDTASEGTATTVEINEGCNFYYDMSGATDPENTWYYLCRGTTNYRWTNFICYGTANNPVTFSASHQWIGSNPANYLYYPYDKASFTHTHFKRMRHDPSLTGNPSYFRGFFIFGGIADHSFTNCVFDDSHRLFCQNNVASGSNQTITNCTWKNCDDLYNISTAVASTLWRMVLDHCVFDQPCLIQWGGLTVRNCIFGNGALRQENVVASPPTVFENNAIRSRTDSDTFINMRRDLNDFFVSTRRSNDKIIYNTEPLTRTVRDSIFEFELDSPGEGEVVSKGNSNATILRCITIGSAAAQAPLGAIAEFGSESNMQRQIKNCTLLGRGVNVGHDPGPTLPNNVTIKDTIVWYPVPTPSAFVIVDIQNNSPDVAEAEDLDYNCTYNLTNPYQAVKNGDPWGANDIQDNPLFVDPTRTMLTWAATQFGLVNPTHDDVWAAFARMNDSDAIAGMEVEHLLAYLRDGFTPTNPALRGTGSDGSDRGAIPVGAVLTCTVTGTNIDGQDSVTFDWKEVSPP